MSFQTPPTRFTGKTWIFVAQSVIFGALAGISLLLGPLFLFGIMKDASGKSAVDADIALTIMSVPFLLVTALAVFNILARRRPIVSICREGVQVNLIGSSSLDGVPLLPSLIRVAWLILSFQGFKQQLLIAPWHSLHHARISGLQMARRFTIVGSFFPVARGGIGPAAPVATEVAFPEVAFDAPLDQVAAAINVYCQNPKLRDSLAPETSWRNSAGQTRN